ncbi:MAG: hypothetical protein LBD22_04565 [Spirochaetaceae bacterium]|jgi:hypothetical protein|nr:hypothetical protein [Spirochaetaceae bacterium]
MKDFCSKTGFILTGLLCLGIFSCDALYNPSFKQFVDEANEIIRNGPTSKGPGTFAWEITYPDEKVAPGKSYLHIRSSQAENTESFELDPWPATPSLTNANGDPVQKGTTTLMSGTYFFKLCLANNDSYVLITKVIVISKDQTTTYKVAFDATVDFRPFKRLAANVKIQSSPQVPLQQMKLEFYDDENCNESNKLPRPERQDTPSDPNASVPWQSDTRINTAPAYNTTWRTEDWSGLPTESAAQFWAKLSVTDTNGRVFNRIRGPYSVISTTPPGADEVVEIDVGLITGNQADPGGSINLLSPLTVDNTGVNNGSFSFKSEGSDGNVYENYAGAEIGYPVYIYNSPDYGYSLDVVELNSDPLLDASNPLIEGPAGASYIQFTMQEFNAAPVPVITGGFEISGIVTLIEPSGLAYKIMKGQYPSLEEALEEAITRDTPQNIIVWVDLIVNADGSGSFFNGTSHTEPLVIPSSAPHIVINCADSHSLNIGRGSGWTKPFFKLDGGNLTLNTEAGSDWSFVDTNAVASAEPYIVVGTGSELSFGSSVNGVGEHLKFYLNTSPAVQIDNGGALKAYGGVTYDAAAALASGISGYNPTDPVPVGITQNGTLNMYGDANFDKGGVHLSSTNFINFSLSGSYDFSATIIPYDYTEGRVLIKRIPGSGGTFEQSVCNRFTVVPPPPDASGQAKPTMVRLDLDNDQGVLYGPEVKLIFVDASYKYFQTLNDALGAVTATSGTDTLELQKNIKMHSSPTFSRNGTQAKLTSAAPSRLTIQRETATSSSLLTITAGSLTLENIVLDGGAIWSAISNNNLLTASNSGLTSTAPLVVLTGVSGSLTLGSNAVVQNNDNISVPTSPGGILVSAGTCTINDGQITQINSITQGAVLVDGSSAILNFTAGSITKNSSFGGNGAGVAVSAGTFNMNGGSITYNVAAFDGGGVYVNGSGTFNLNTAGGIVNNTANRYGGGVYSLATNGFVMKGPAQVDTNNNNDVYGCIYLDSTFTSASNPLARITPQSYPTSGTRQVLYGSNISTYHNKFWITPQPVTGGAPGAVREWLIDATGKIYYNGLDVDCSLDANLVVPVLSFTLPTNPVIVQSSGTINVIVNSTTANFTSATWQIKVDSTAVSPSVASDKKSASFSIPGGVLAGQHTVTVLITIGSKTWSGDFQIYYMQ